MSQAHVEIAKRGIDAYNRRDVDAFADLTTPGYEWVPALAIVEGGGFRGREGIETYFEDMRNHWEEVRVFTDELRDLGVHAAVLKRQYGGPESLVGSGRDRVILFRGSRYMQSAEQVAR